MMSNNKVKILVFNALIASIYIVLTLILAPISYSTKLIFIEFRLSEILLVLSFYNKKYGPGILVGCFLANLLGSTLGIIDWIFGTLQTGLSILTYYLVKKLPFKTLTNLIIGSVINSIHCGLIIGAVLTYVYCDGTNYLPFFGLQFLGVFIGELIILIFGICVFSMAFKNKEFRRIMDVE